MSWFGKLIGGSIGFMFGGPLGALAVGALGHYFIDSNIKNVSFEDPYQQSPEQYQYVFFLTLFSLLGKLAKADGVVTREEIKVVSDYINGDLRLDSQQKQVAISIFNRAKDDKHYTFQQLAQHFYEINQGNYEILINLINLLMEVAVSDGVFHPAEEQMIIQAVRTFNISDREYQQIKIAYGISGTSGGQNQRRYSSVSETDKYYAILKSSPEDDNATIKRNYKKLVKEYHPDKIIAKGLPPEFEEFANQKFKEIQESWEKIREIRKI